jgi:hypothetical protein
MRSDPRHAPHDPHFATDRSALQESAAAHPGRQASACGFGVVKALVPSKEPEKKSSNRASARIGEHRKPLALRTCAKAGLTDGFKRVGAPTAATRLLRSAPARALRRPQKGPMLRCGGSHPQANDRVPASRRRGWLMIVRLGRGRSDSGCLCVRRRRQPISRGEAEAAEAAA